MIGFFALFICITVILLQRHSLKDGVVHITGNHRVTEKLVEVGQNFELIISFRNVTKHYIPFLKVSEYLPKGMNVVTKEKMEYKNDVLGKQVAFTSFLAPKKKSEFHVKVYCEKRGRYLLKDLVFTFGDFIGLQQKKQSICPYQEIVVAPQEVQTNSLDEVLGGFLGDVSVQRFMFEDPVLTAGYRNYTGREPMKQISWTQSSKGNGLMVKKFDYTLEPAVTVILDVDGLAMNQESLFEKSYSLARTVCQKVEDQGIKYDFYTNCTSSGAIKEFSYIDEGLGALHFAQILECLGRGGFTSNESLTSLLEKVNDTSSMSVGKILITPTLQTKDQAQQWINKTGEQANWIILVAEEVEK